MAIHNSEDVNTLASCYDCAKSRLYTQQKLGLTMKNDELEAKVNQTSTEIMELVPHAKN